MQTVLITGIDGFTGIHLADALLNRGWRVHGIVRQDSGALVDARIALERCDLHDQPGLAEIIRRVQPDKIVHLAAISFVVHGDVDEIYTTNLIGTRHLLEAACTPDRQPSAVLVASSANIYGNRNAGVIDENCVPSPVNDYATSKLAMEHMARLYLDRLPVIITRPFNYTGVGQSVNFLIPKIVAHVKRRAPFIELGNIDVERDFSDVRSVADIYRRLLDEPAAIGRTVNICSGRALSLRQILEMACDFGGHRMEVRVNPAFVRQNEVRTLTGSTSALEELIGTLGPYKIEDTIRWMLAAA